MSTIRTRWAAIGAAVAVVLGAGGVGLVGATLDSGERSVFVPISPCRLLDTRPADNVGPRDTPIGADETYIVTTHGTNGQCTLPADAVGLSLNVTGVDATSRTFLTIWPDGALPTASNLNLVPGQPPTPNAVTTDLSATGTFNIYNFEGTVHTIVDVNGYFADHTHDDRYDTSDEVDAKIAANPGPQGPPGADGGSCSVTDNGDDTGTLTCDDGTSVVIPTISPGLPDGEIIDATGDGTGNPLDGPRDIAVDGSNNVYVTGLDSDNVFKVEWLGGAVTQIIDATGDGTGNTLDAPFGVAVDAAGNVYVTGDVSDNAFKVTPGGVIAEIIDATGDGAGNTLDGPRGIAVDGSGNVYVTGWDTDNAFKVTSGGVITEIIDTTGDGSSDLDAPQMVAVDAAGNVYVTGDVSDNAFEVTSGGVITEIINALGDGTGNGLNGTFGVAVDAAGHVYVAGAFSSNAFKVTP